MSTTETETAVPAQDPPAVHDDPSPEFPAPPRRPGTRRARALAILSLVAAFGATGYVVATAVEPAADTPLEEATAPAWEATSALSDALRELRPGGSRNAARPLAGAAAKAVGAAEKRVEALDLPISQTPVRSRVLETLRADAAWIDAVGSTLANPRSPRRAELSRLAKRAATGTALIADDLEAAKGSVSGTGRLLAATKPEDLPAPAASDA